MRDASLLRGLAVTAGAALGMAMGVYLLVAALSFPRPAGAYAGMGVMMMLPFLALGVGAAAIASSVVVAIVGNRAGLGRLVRWLMCLIAACLAVYAFILGVDAPRAL